MSEPHSRPDRVLLNMFRRVFPSTEDVLGLFEQLLDERQEL